MPRAPLPLGTWGKIRTRVAHVDAKGAVDRYRAIAQYRGHDGKTRQVEAYGKTVSGAENNLRARLKDRAATSRKGELTAMHRFSAAADLWLARISDAVRQGRRSAGTLDIYRRQLDSHVLPAVGDVRLGELTTPRIDKVLTSIMTDVGAQTARTCRSVISGVMGLAVRYGAIPVNPVREVDRIEVTRKKQPRALSVEEWATWMAQLQADERAVAKDLPDLSVFMIATGARIGETLAVLWSQVDLTAGCVEITHTIIRVRGEGLLRKGTKSRAGERVLALPASAVSMLRARFMVGVRLDDPVFPDTFGGFRDPSNTRRDFREARGDGVLAWVTSHSFRKTTATILDSAGQSGRQVADQLGHARPSMTQDVYLARKVANPLAAEVLDRMLRGSSDGDENHG